MSIDVQPEVGHNTYYWLGVALVVVGLAMSGVETLESFAVTSIGLGALVIILGAHWQKHVTLRTVVLVQQRRIERLELMVADLGKNKLDKLTIQPVGEVVPQHPSLDT